MYFNVLALIAVLGVLLLVRSRPSGVARSFRGKSSNTAQTAPQGTDISKGILDAIDVDSYRAENKATEKIALADDDAEVSPVLAGHIGDKPEPELDKLSNAIKTFNDLFGNVPGWARASMFICSTRGFATQSSTRRTTEMLRE
jgi:hypothetical protein